MLQKNNLSSVLLLFYELFRPQRIQGEYIDFSISGKQRQGRSHIY